jgi:hypothetical protein
MIKKTKTMIRKQKNIISVKIIITAVTLNIIRSINIRRNIINIRSTASTALTRKRNIRLEFKKGIIKILNVKVLKIIQGSIEIMQEHFLMMENGKHKRKERISTTGLRMLLRKLIGRNVKLNS